MNLIKAAYWHFQLSSHLRHRMCLNWQTVILKCTYHQACPGPIPREAEAKLLHELQCPREKEKQDTPTHPDSSPGSGLWVHQQLHQTTMHDILLVAIFNKLSADRTTVEVGGNSTSPGWHQRNHDRKKAMSSYLYAAQQDLFFAKRLEKQTGCFLGPSNAWVNWEVSDIHRWEETKFIGMDTLCQTMYFQQNTQQSRQGWHCCALTALWQNRERWQEGQRVFSQRSSSTISTLVGSGRWYQIHPRFWGSARR